MELRQTSATEFVIDTKLTDSQSGFRAYSKKILDNITPSDRGMGVSTELLIKASKQGFSGSKKFPSKFYMKGTHLLKILFLTGHLYYLAQ